MNIVHSCFTDNTKIRFICVLFMQWSYRTGRLKTDDRAKSRKFKQIHNTKIVMLLSQSLLWNKSKFKRTVSSENSKNRRSIDCGPLRWFFLNHFIFSSSRLVFLFGYFFFACREEKGLLFSIEKRDNRPFSVRYSSHTIRKMHYFPQ